MKSLPKPNRPSYTKVDTEDREAQLSSRTDILKKSFATSLWMKVIAKSIDDAALYKFMKKTGKKLKEEEEEFEMSAWNFLFNDNYSIPMDDYIVNISCIKCENKWDNYMSKTAGSNSVCPKCGNKTSWKHTQYKVIDNQIIREISLRELISLWGIDDIDNFRNGCKNRIEALVQKKLNTENKRILNLKRRKQKEEMKKEEPKENKEEETKVDEKEKTIIEKMLDKINDLERKIEELEKKNSRRMVIDPRNVRFK